MLYKLCDDKIDNKAFGNIIKSAAKCAQSFIGDSFSVDLIGMNSKLMEYTKVVADRLCYALKRKQICNVKTILDRTKNVNIFVMCFLSEIVNIVYHIDFICLFFFLVQ